MGNDAESPDKTWDSPFKYRVLAKVIDLSKTVIRGGIGLGALWIIKETIIPFAGSESTADIEILYRLATDLSADKWAAYILGGGGLIYGLRERKLRKKYIERMSDRIKSLEEKIDPGRSSSGLPKTGDTKPTD